jgi:hypothetical protein
VHEGQSFPCDLAEGVGVFNEAAQDTGTALGRFISEDRAAVVAAGNGSPRISPSSSWKTTAIPRKSACWTVAIVSGRVGIRIEEAEQQRVLAIAHDRHDADRPHDIGRHIDIRFLVFRLCPVAAARVDVEAEDGLVLAPFQALVDPADLGAVGILQGEDGCFAATEISLVT